MPVFIAFVLYLLGGLLLATVLLPVAYPFIESALGQDTEPSRALYRLAMLLMLLGLPWFLKGLRLDRWHTLGFTLPVRPAWAAVFLGVCMGVAILSVVVFGLQLSGVRYFSPRADLGAGELLEVALVALISGLLIGLVEETFFRGMIHAGMRRSMSFWPTALLTGTFYAAVHFIRPAELPAGLEVDLAASVGMLTAGLAHLGDLPVIHDSFLALLMAGIFLSMVRERTGNIFWVIGIHAGWVLVIRLTKLLTDVDYADGLPIWVGNYDGVTGWMAFIWLALLVLVCSQWRSPRRELAAD